MPADTQLEISEAVIADYLRAQAAGLAKELPQLRDLRINIGNYSPSNRVAISGYIAGETRLRPFVGPTIAAAVAEARKFIALLP